MTYTECIADVRQQVAAWRRQSLRVGFVATMGNLHAGHLSLVSLAKQSADRIVASIFVNPMQFGNGEDFDTYPRTLDDDRRQLQAAGVDLLFAPTDEQMYPDGQHEVTQVVVPKIADDLCGARRPGHFTGVATVVTKLFNVVQPDTAIFGQKDYQQLVLIRQLVRDLCLPIEVLGAPTCREPDGLAMSSRNQYLTDSERAAAPALQAALKETASALLAGQRNHAVLAGAASVTLKAAGFQPEYYEVRRADNLAVAGPHDRNLIIVAAARLGKARLIDNLLVTLPEAPATPLP